MTREEIDCISREQAKASIRDKFKDLPSRVEINTILNELPSVTLQEPKWIPVSERLPEIDEDGYSSYVLVSFSNFTLPFIGQLRKTDGENHWYEGDDEEALDSFGLHVNAWMPLPEPYKSESEDKE